jgi:pimeloyl-ACP methyl ester carboxylesterase
MTNPRKHHVHRRALGGPGAVLAVAGLFLGLVTLTGSATSTASTTHGGSDGVKPTIVLVHGAFADASGWNGVTRRLQKKGYTVIAPPNPLRSVEGDSAYLGSVLDTIEGPVVLVGHSYGGVLITNAGAGRPQVKALVYVAAFAPDEGETVGGLAGMNPGSRLTPENLTIRPHPGGLDAYIEASVFHEVFAADVPRKDAAVMASSQRPGDLATLNEPSGPPAWKTVPSWYLVATQDHVLPAATERFMAERAHAHTVEVDASHVAMISHPRAVTRLILDAAGAGA